MYLVEKYVLDTSLFFIVLKGLSLFIQRNHFSSILATTIRSNYIELGTVCGIFFRQPLPVTK